VLQDERDEAVLGREQAEKSQQASDREMQRAMSAEQSVREQLRLMKDQKDENENTIKNLSEKERAANAQARRAEMLYHEYKSKADDPDLFDAVVKKAEWLKNPHLVGVDAAYNKGLHLIGPGLTSTQMALIEMQAMLKTSSEHLTSMVGKPELSPIMSGVLTYGILLIPLIVSLLVVVRLRNTVSLEKAAMWMTLYNALFCAFLFGLYMWLGIEPLSALKSHHRSVYEFLQFAVAAGYVLYCVVVLLTTVKQVVFARCTVTLRAMLQCVLPVCVGVNYYLTAWVPAMLDTDKEHIEGKSWGVYALGFVLQLLLLTCGRVAKTTRVGVAGGSLTKPFLLPAHKQKLNDEHKKESIRRQKAAKAKSKMSDFESGVDSDVGDDDLETGRSSLNNGKSTTSYDPPPSVVTVDTLVRRSSVSANKSHESSDTKAHKSSPTSGEPHMDVTTSSRSRTNNDKVLTKSKSKARGGGGGRTETERNKKKTKKVSSRSKSRGGGGSGGSSTVASVPTSAGAAAAVVLGDSLSGHGQREGMEDVRREESHTSTSKLELHIMSPSEVIAAASEVASGVTGVGSSGGGGGATIEKQD
jgi:hypothetical protein